MAGPNPYTMLTVTAIHELLESSADDLTELRALYDRLPATRCERKAHCCSMLPEMTFLEGLAAFRRLSREAAGLRSGVLKRIVEYFFVNPVRITSCPFLEEKQCLIYEDRFFGCRAYGLWSPEHYENMAGQNRQAKIALGQQWRNLGIKLPENVIEFKLPYCLDVATVHRSAADDDTLAKISGDINALSKRLSPWHQTFGRMYFADLSFLTTALIYEVGQILRMKVSIVRDYLAAGRSKILDNALEKVPDFLN
jgi:hypothetical protein